MDFELLAPKVYNFLRQPTRRYFASTVTKMAIAGNKRRKIDHVSSGDEEDDAASFASFGDEASSEETKAVNGD